MKNTKVISVVMVICISILLSACGVKDKAETKIGEKIVEQQIEKQTGAKVDIDSDKDSMSIKSADGQVEYSTSGVKVPDSFPKELLVGQANPIMNTSMSGGTSLTYVTDQAKQSVFNELLKLQQSGWKKEVEVNSGDGLMIIISKDKQKATVTVGDYQEAKVPGQTIVTVILVSE